MSSMADLTRNLGWIAWCLTVLGWFLSPIISLLVNKTFAYLVFDTSKKLKELENEIIRKLKQTLSVVEEQTVLRAAEDKGSPDDLKILDNMKMDLKSALYEAEDILDLLDYRRIEKDLHHGDDDSVWVKSQLAAASAWIARCKGSWFGRWIDSTFAAVMKSAQSSMTRQKQFVIQGWRHSMQNIKIAGAAVVQCAQSWSQQLKQLFKRVVLRRSDMLLPVSINRTRQPPCSEEVEETSSEKEIEEESCEEGGETSEEEIQAPCSLVQPPRTSSLFNSVFLSQQISQNQPPTLKTSQHQHRPKPAEQSEDDDEENWATSLSEDDDEENSPYTSSDEEYDEAGKEGEPTSFSILLCCARSMLTWFAKACFYRDWSYGIVGISFDKEGDRRI